MKKLSDKGTLIEKHSYFPAVPKQFGSWVIQSLAIIGPRDNL